jgi:hypothetical protein
VGGGDRPVPCCSCPIMLKAGLSDLPH